MQLRYLKSVSLKKANKEKQSNGVKVSTYSLVDNYRVQFEDLSDEVSASIYGANLYKVKKVKSPRKRLESYLSTKLSNEKDNISKYFLFVDNVTYKINDVSESGVTIERV